MADQITGSTSDGYHTFDELYEHRTVLFASLCNLCTLQAWKSRKHADGSMSDGFFIAGMTLFGVGDVSYHVEDKYWDLFQIEERPAAPEFTGYTAQDVVDRLASYFCHAQIQGQ